MQQPHQENLRNLLIAVVLSLGILYTWQVMVNEPKLEAERARLALKQQEEAAKLAAIEAKKPVDQKILPREEILPQSRRLRIDSPRLHGSINLRGARFDDLTLADYHVSLEQGSPEVVLLSPSRSPSVYFAEFGWSASTDIALPGSDTLWTADREVMRPGEMVTLSWDNGMGQIFRMQITLDEDYLFTLQRSVENRNGDVLSLTPYGLVNRTYAEDPIALSPLLHEGPIGVFNQTLEEVDYDTLEEETAPVQFASNGGWLGISDKYWLTAIIPAQSGRFTAAMQHFIANEQDRYQVSYAGASVTVPPGNTVTVTEHLFAGAKKVSLLDSYGASMGLPLFDRAVDFGWLYFLTKPIFYMLTWLHGLLGSFGLAILALTVIIKLAMFPLANKSYLAMTQIKALQPEMLKLRERFGEDKVRMQQEIMQLYKKSKVNPAAGCLPILIQLPVFFALYKVLFVTIEMRHAPFYGWIQDLSAPDPTNIFTLFGLVPWNHPEFLSIGAWPLIMTATMILQQRLNPTPTDPMQEKVLKLLPWFFLILLAGFPAGLVIYWAWSNTLSVLQQQYITRSARRKGLIP